MKKIKNLTVSTPQGEAGSLLRESVYVFNYSAKTREQQASLVMPIRAESYTEGNMFPEFSMNLPEGALLARISERLLPLGKVTPMMLLAATGMNQIGRLRYQEPGAVAGPRRAQIGKEELLKQNSSEELFEFLLDAYLESGISGVQPKVMIPDADKPAQRSTLIHSDLIVKASGEDFQHLAMNEFLCMSVAKEAGLPVAPFWLSEDGGLFVMERFDVKDSAQLGFEDITALTRKSSEDKYQGSYEGIAKLIQLVCRENAVESANRLFEYLTLSIMVRNGDAHLKNFGLLYEHPGVAASAKLAPIYDVVTTTVYKELASQKGIKRVFPEMALNLNKNKNYPSRKELVTFGHSCSVKHPEQVIERIGDAMQKVLVQHGDRANGDLLRLMKREWDAGRLNLEPQPFTKTRHMPKMLATPVTREANIQTGNYVGPVQAVDEKFIFQHLGRDTQVKHDRNLFNETPALGSMMRLRYREGRIDSLEFDTAKTKQKGSVER